jgi:hypothetical protein
VRQNLAPGEYVPQIAKSGIFALCELPFLVLSGLGVALLARRRVAFRRYRWPALYALGTVVIFFSRSGGRGWIGFHYLFIAIAVAAVGCGYLTDRVLLYLSPSISFRREWVALGFVALAVHGVAMWAATDSRVRDVGEYQRLGLGALYDALGSLGPGERVLVVGRRPIRNLHGLTDSYSRRGARSTLVEEVESLFVRRRSFPPSDRTTEGLTRNGVTRILDARGPTIMLRPLTAWQAPALRR